MSQRECGETSRALLLARILAQSDLGPRPGPALRLPMKAQGTCPFCCIFHVPLLGMEAKLISQLASEALSALSMTWPDLMDGAFILKTNPLFSSSQLIENEAMTLDKANTE